MKISTKAIHGNHCRQHKIAGAPVVFPIFQTSNFHLGEHEYSHIVAGETRSVNLYTRLGNPTCRNAAEKFAALHNAERAELYTSGLGAISAVLLSFLSAGDSLVTSLDIYGGTVSLINRELSRLGIEIINIDPVDYETIKAAVKPNTKMLYFETITNPMLKIPSFDALAKVARENNILLVIDNTFASPVLFRPLEHGADIVIESSTKYLGGHSDCVGGFAAGSDTVMKRVWSATVSLGATADPFAAFLVERGMKTLPLRMKAHCENAAKVARFLAQHKAVEKVIYPGIETDASFGAAKKYLESFGGMISFIVKGGDAAGLKFIDNLNYFVAATSLGGVESLIEMPFNTSHAPLTPEERAKVGIVPGFVRLSVGIEDIDDLTSDLQQALDSICQ